MEKAQLLESGLALGLVHGLRIGINLAQNSSVFTFELYRSINVLRLHIDAHTKWKTCVA